MPGTETHGPETFRVAEGESSSRDADVPASRRGWVNQHQPDPARPAAPRAAPPGTNRPGPGRISEDLPSAARHRMEDPYRRVNAMAMPGFRPIPGRYRGFHL